jgi:hypothetical protein
LVAAAADLAGAERSLRKLDAAANRAIEKKTNGS